MIEIEKRIIKFRAWNRKNKTVDYDGGFLFDLEDFNIEHYKYLCLNIFINKISDELDLMQFVGEHDIHGKEIYEADLVKWREPIDKEQTNDDIFGLVLWDREDCRFLVLQLTKGNWAYKVGDSIVEHDAVFYSHGEAEFSWGELEIIGNIYENPDLYEKLKQD